jgi:hypothetical protein
MKYVLGYHIPCFSFISFDSMVDLFKENFEYLEDEDNYNPQNQCPPGALSIQILPNLQLAFGLASKEYNSTELALQ